MRTKLLSLVKKNIVGLAPKLGNPFFFWKYKLGILCLSASNSTTAQAIVQPGKRSDSYRPGSGVGGDGDDAVAALGVAAEDGLRPLAGTVILAPPLPVVGPVTLVEGRLSLCYRGSWRRRHHLRR